MTKKKPISWEVLFRDRDLYRILMRRARFNEKLLLLDIFDQEGYGGYQRELFRLAKEKGIEIPAAS